MTDVSGDYPGARFEWDSYNLRMWLMVSGIGLTLLCWQKIQIKPKMIWADGEAFGG